MLTWAVGFRFALNKLISAQKLPSATGVVQILSQGCLREQQMVTVVNLPQLFSEYNVINSWHLTKNIILYTFFCHSSPG